MFYWKKLNISLIVGLVFIFSTFLVLQAQASWVVCDSWICATPFDYENFGTMCYSTNKAEDCATGGACTGSTNMDCGGWSCPDATITCNPTGYGGCTDRNAYNWDPGASFNDGSCQYSVYGCTDPNAVNFVGYPPSVVDNGSCQYFVNLNFWVTNQIGQPISGAAVNIGQDYGNGSYRGTDGGGFANFGVYMNNMITYSVSAGSCSGSSGSVWTGAWSNNVYVTLNCTLPVYGCTDPNATNYNPSANVNNGTCSYCAANMGSSCSSSANACGQTQANGTIQCNGSCSSTPPANPPGYGNACTSAPSACGQTSSGTIQCNGSCSAVTPPLSSCPATVTNISTSPTTIAYSGSSTISWSSSNANSCTASEDWSGAKTLSGSQSTGALNQVRTYTYTLSCTGYNGTDVKSATVTVSPPTPTTSNVTITEPDYCASGPAVTISWGYSDPASSPQSAYQVQLDDQASFNSPAVDSGKVISGSSAWFSGQGALAFNTVYHARVRTWSGYDVPSAWQRATICSGPGCTGGGADSWKTPTYAYPQVDFSWTANNILNNPGPPLNKPVTFSDATVFGGNPNGRRWAWVFGDGGTSTFQNPSHIYSAEGSYYVTLTATDNANQACARTKGPLIIQKPIPKWREVAPR